MDPADAADRRERDALAAATAAAVDADLFITERTYLLARRTASGRGTTICTVREALAITGLYLRAQHEFISWAMANGTMFYFRGWYYWVGAWELLPEVWRWTSACGQHARAIGDDQLPGLCLTLTRRLQAVLAARDRLHRSLNVPQTPSTGRAVLGELDSILVLLMATADIIARVTDLGFPS
jgi:hypothetical protein